MLDSESAFYSLQYTVTHVLSFTLLVMQLVFYSENVLAQKIKISAEFMFLIYQMTLMIQSDANTDLNLKASFIAGYETILSLIPILLITFIMVNIIVRARQKFLLRSKKKTVHPAPNDPAISSADGDSSEEEEEKEEEIKEQANDG